MNPQKEVRRVKRGDATRTCNAINTDLSLLSPQILQQRLAHCKDLLEDLKDLDDKIFLSMCIGDFTELQRDQEYENSSTYRQNLLEAVAKLELCLNPPTPPNLPVGTDARINVPRSGRLKLPELPLPTFSNKPNEDLDRFFENFEQMIEKFSLQDLEKYLLLIKSLSGDPLTIVDSLSKSSQTYAGAKDLLSKAFATKPTQRFNTISRLSKLKFGIKDDPYKFISDFRMLTDSFKSLEITVDHILQYHIWNAMNPEMQNILISITNKNKPDLNDIDVNIFEATERYKSSIKISKPSASKFNENSLESTDIHAAAVTYPKKNFVQFCSLCSKPNQKDTSHSTWACKLYPDPLSKINKIKEANGCLRCSNLMHTTNRCNHRFNRKCFCNEFHYSFLCPKSMSEPKKTGANAEPVKNVKYSKYKAKDVDTKQIETGSVFVGNVKLERYGEDSIVPTFSLDFPLGKSIRIMRDSGCMANFIKDSVAVEWGCKIVNHNFPIKINGFLSTESSKYKVVEVKLLEKFPPVLAICMPKIKGSTKLPGLTDVVSEFASKGYNMADKFLAREGVDCINDVDFILGNNDAHILPMRDVSFGMNPPSVFTETPLGVCLMGGVKRILDNIGQLPERKVGQIDSNATLAKNDASKKPKKPKKKSGINSQSVKSQQTLTKKSSTLSNETSHGDHSTAETSLDSDIIENSFCILSMKVAIDTTGYVNDSLLDNAANEILRCSKFNNFDYDDGNYNDISKELDDELTEFVLDTTFQNANGHLVMNLLWNGKVSHLLGRNDNLSRSVLNSNLRRLQKNPERLRMYDEVIQTQVKNDIVEKIPDLPDFLKNNPNASFLPHMAVFKLDRETTKTRVVMLSNLCEKLKSHTVSISHNQAIHSGKNLNRKISTALTRIRFDSYLFCADIKKAFNCIKLNEIDQSRLLFHWFRDVENGDFSIIGLKFKSLPFGLRCSPTLMMLALYKILILDSDETDQHKNLKKLIFDLVYMDNIFLTSEDPALFEDIVSVVRGIFEPYKMFLQQFYCNIPDVQSELDTEFEQETGPIIKILGMEYNRFEDSLSTMKLSLDRDANTKRKIISSIASNFCILQINCPLLNRARLFAHKIQCSDVGWDDVLTVALCKEWRNICNQLNSSPKLTIGRYIGCRANRTSLVCFSDASKDMVGVVIYVRDESTGKVSFLQARNRIVGKGLEGKTIPALELHALSLGVTTVLDVYNELTGPSSVVPIYIDQIFCFSDSMCALNWVNSWVNKLSKLQKQSPFVMNRLLAIEKLCVKSVNFGFIAGNENPADLTTRPVSAKQLTKSSYLEGPSFISGPDAELKNSSFSFMVPNPLANQGPDQILVDTVDSEPSEKFSPLINFENFSSFSKLARVMSFVMKSVKNFKSFLKIPSSDCFDGASSNPEYFQSGIVELIKIDQKENFPDIVQFFQNPKVSKSKIPMLVTQLNIFADHNGILRVRTKFQTWKANPSKLFPILLGNYSKLAKLIIDRIHTAFAHSGKYSVLTELRKNYYIPTIFSVVKKVLKECLYSRRLNGRTVKLNQSSYRQFRTDPPDIPFRQVFIDHCGPYHIKISNKTQKVWLLVISCLWSRAVNLLICYDMTLKEFLRNLQIHILKYGISEKIYSDSGVQMTSGGNVVMDFLKDHESKKFFDEHGMGVPTFVQYAKGNHCLGGLVESAVKTCKKLLGSAIKTYVLDLPDFEVAVAQANYYANVRPIAFKTALRDCSVDMAVPEPITPQMLLSGYDTPSINILPEHQEHDSWEAGTTSISKVRDHYEKLSRVRQNMRTAYNEEFLGTLLDQSDDVKGRYSPVEHKQIKTGDLVLLKEDYCKALDYPMARVVGTTKNSLNETTEVQVRKGSNREVVRRHVASIIPFLSLNESEENCKSTQPPPSNVGCRPKRKAAKVARQRCKDILDC